MSDPALPPTLVDRVLAESVLDHASPLVAHALVDPDVGGTGCLHVVVMDPARPPGMGCFEDALLCERSHRRDGWDADDAMYARAKARVAWRTGGSTSGLLDAAPRRFAPDDIRIPGAVACDGLVVAASGARPWFDEAIAHAIVAWILAAARARVEAGDGPFAR